MGILLTLAAAAAGLAAPQPIDPGSWVTSADYPAAALRASQGGNVGYVLDIDARGAVTACRIIRPSGADALDRATCKLVKRRAQFVAGHDAAGKAAASTYTGTVHWMVPQNAPILAGPGAAPSDPAFSGLRGGGLGALRQPLLPQFLPPLGPRSVPRRLTWPIFPVATAVPTIDVPENQSPPADPAVRYGQLANGVRYAILPRATVLGGVSIRMQVAAGSLDESDRQRGYAHLIEHMIFRGSKNIPDGQFAKSLEGLGMTLGRDTAAYTTQEATLFVLDFPHSAVAPAKTGLSLLREAVERATIAPGPLAAERGVVLAERRVRDDPETRASQARIGFLLAGQPAASRWAIGTLDGITNASAGGLRAFYRAHYRPENLILVVCGNVDAGEVAGEIKDSFGDWEGQGTPPSVIDQGHVPLRFAQVHLSSEPGAPAAAEADWVADYQPEADTLAHERRIVAQNLVAAIVNARLGRLSEEVAAPFVGASLQSGPIFHSAMVTTLATMPKPGMTDAAIAAALVEKRRLLRYGVTRPEFDRAASEMRATLARMVENGKSPDVGAVANELLYTLNYARVFTTAAQTAADTNKIVSSLTLADVNAAAAQMFGGSGPLIFVSSASPPQGGEPALRAAVAQADSREVTPPAANTTPPWPYTQFGPPGRVVDRTVIADLGVTMVRFANGTSITVRSIPETRDQIIVDMNFGHGLAGLPPGLAQSYWQVGSPAQTFVVGGLGKLAVSELTDIFAGRRVGIQFSMTDSRMQLAGETSKADFDTELQLLTAYVADPGFRPAAFAKALTIAQTGLAQADATASLTMLRDLGKLLSGGDRRLSMSPTAADLAVSRPEDLAAILRPALAGPINLVVVGDVDVERAIAAAQATIGALPPRGPRPPAPPAFFPAAPAQPVLVATHGNVDDAVAVAAWPTPGFFASTADARALQVLGGIIQGRLLDGLREKDGLTYSPGVLSDQSTLDDYGWIAIDVELTPDKTPLFYTTIAAIADDLARRPVSIDELNRARAPMVDESRRRLRISTDIAAALVGADEEPRTFAMIRSRLPELLAVTPQDIQRLAGKYLSGIRPYRVIFEPALAAAH